MKFGEFLFMYEEFLDYIMFYLCLYFERFYILDVYGFYQYGEEIYFIDILLLDNVFLDFKGNLFFSFVEVWFIVSFVCQVYWLW